jgi:hypothetical protein
VADVAVLVGVAWTLKLREYEEMYVFNGQTHELALQPGRTQGWQASRHLQRKRSGTAAPTLSRGLPDRGRLVLMAFGDGQVREEGSISRWSRSVGSTVSPSYWSGWARSQRISTWACTGPPIWLAGSRPGPGQGYPSSQPNSPEPTPPNKVTGGRRDHARVTTVADRRGPAPIRPRTIQAIR